MTLPFLILQGVKLAFVNFTSEILSQQSLSFSYKYYFLALINMIRLFFYHLLVNFSIFLSSMSISAYKIILIFTAVV
jgi:hypothetical protein